MKSERWNSFSASPIDANCTFGFSVATFTSNQEIVLAAVASNPLALQFASEVGLIFRHVRHALQDFIAQVC